ncbi:MFS transporter, partial [bacterium]|nr:MFS transporter [bacterium]
PARRRQGLFFVGAACAVVGVVMAVQMGVNSNFVGNVMKLSGFQQGLLEGIRESCGVFALLVLALLAGMAEPLLGGAMLLLLAVGLGAYAWVPTFPWLIAAGLVWSQGLHVWMPLPNSMTLSLAEPGRAGYRLGQIRAAGSAGFAVGIGLALLLSWAGVGMRPMYLVAFGFGVVAAGLCLGVPRDIKTPGPRFVFRKKYGLYYVLSFLEGWRKQIFVCFAGFLLVKEYGTPLTTMLLLFGGVQVISYFASPWVGRLIDRVGERPVLMFYFACLSVFFVGYAFVRDVRVLYALFVVDSAFFVFATALTTYVNRIAPPSEHTPTLSMGVAMNHVAAVIMPILGGVLWVKLGHEWAFLTGSAAAVVSVFVAMRVPRLERTVSDGPPSPAPH